MYQCMLLIFKFSSLHLSILIIHLSFYLNDLCLLKMGKYHFYLQGLRCTESGGVWNFQFPFGGIRKLHGGLYHSVRHGDMSIRGCSLIKNYKNAPGGENCEIFKNNSLSRTPLAAASVTLSGPDSHRLILRY